ncbi:MAG TPA: branched-chain amino acid transaminase, partial [Gammaproteobacteria bacterium]|nr:branched-chain amino acid transaminase [Gammaproteobacteria bacterium]
ANYQNGRLATIQARADGYNEAILLTRSGKVAESAGACLMAIRDGIVITPTVTGSILESVTRATLIELFERELSMEVQQREIDRTELYVCQEVFLCGSGYEVMPIVDIDGYRIGDGTVGKNTQAIFDTYDAATRGANNRYDHWLTSV